MCIVGSIIPRRTNLFLQVEIHLSRDADSAVSGRESSAVQDWLKTNKSFHFLRDHPDQGTYILGGGWGWRATPLTRKAWSKAWKAALKDPLSWAGRREVGPDQTWLTRYTTRSIIKK